MKSPDRHLARVIVGRTIADAWLNAAEFLYCNGREAFGLMVEITEPNAWGDEDLSVKDCLDQYLASHDKSSIETVAGTIFPSEYYNPGEAQALYDTYDENWPLIEALSTQNKYGTYFRRLTHLNVVSKDGTQTAIRPLEQMIDKMRVQLTGNGSTFRCVYPLCIYQPGIDAQVRYSFPCMTFLDLKISDGLVHLTAQYRNQMYITKAFGNFVGLAALQNFVAEEIGLKSGHLLCLATHAELDNNVPAVQRLLRECKHQLGANADV
jgi:hypothetical protein